MTVALIDRYRERLPVNAATPVVSLGEGSTPLLRAPRLSERLGVELWLKWEAANPTGSYKDRGMTVGVSHAKAVGARVVACASTGNTSASLASYAAAAGMRAAAVGCGQCRSDCTVGLRVAPVAPRLRGPRAWQASA